MLFWFMVNITVSKNRHEMTQSAGLSDDTDLDMTISRRAESLKDWHI